MARTGENIYKRKDGRWEARYIFSYTETGKAKYKYLYAPTYGEVKSKLIKALTCSGPIENDKHFDKETYTYWLDKWLSSKKLVVKQSTYVRYRNSIERHIKPELGKYPISKISTELMSHFIKKKLSNGRLDGKGGLSPKTTNDILIIIKETFKFAQSYGVVTVCNFDRIQFKKPHKEMRVLSPLEEKQLLTVLFDSFDRYKLGVFLCLYTGIRIGELCSLKWKNVSLTENTIKIEETLQRLQSYDPNILSSTLIVISAPKSFAAQRTIPLPDFAVEILKPFETYPEAYLLTGKSNLFVEPRTMQNHFKKYLRQAGIEDANFHALRHTFATRCVEVGFDIKTLSEILGHTSVKTTLDRYVHSSMQQKRDNMAKLRLGTG